MEAARFTKATFPGCEVSLESRIPEAVRSQLERMGHKLVLWGPFSQRVGGGQAILRNNTTGLHFGASDPRKDGAAIPESPDFTALRR
jgi:gamma-glutamyltranspeptidase/glutathione hydrolase